MPLATSHVLIAEGLTFCKVLESVGAVPWSEVNDTCSFQDAELSRKLYPDVKVGMDRSDERPPIRLFDAATQTFPIGLLKRVREALEEQGVQVELKNDVPKPTTGFAFKWQGPEPRDYQVKAVEDAVKTSRFGIIQVPTGGGKTLIGALLIRTLGLRTLWIVHSADLVRQTGEFLAKYLGAKAGEVGAGRHSFKTITVITAQSLRKTLEEMKAREWLPDLMLEDEVHHAGAHETYMALQKVQAYYRYGLTATPFRTGPDTIVLEAAYGQVISQIGLKELQDRGFLTKILVRAREIEAAHAIPKGISKWDEIYAAGIVRHPVRNQMITEAVKEALAEGRQVLVDVDELEHLDLLLPTLDQATGQKVAAVTGAESPTSREKIYQRFRAGELRVLAGTVLREGIDLPSVGAIILAGGKKSKIQVLQEIGRGLRAVSGKENCVVVDFIDHQHYLLFEHCQQRFKAMQSAGFEIPEDAVRKIQIEADKDGDDDIARIRERQDVLKARTTKDHVAREDD